MKYLMQLVSLFTDLDECEEIDFICGLDGICVNKNGTYDCVCPEGQTRNPNDGRCEGTLYTESNEEGRRGTVRMLEAEIVIIVRRAEEGELI